MNRINEIKYMGGYTLWVRFDDGESKMIDFEYLIGEGIGSHLLDIEYFKHASIDNGGGIEWPNGFDFCPNCLKELESNAQRYPKR